MPIGKAQEFGFFIIGQVKCRVYPQVKDETCNIHVSSSTNVGEPSKGYVLGGFLCFKLRKKLRKVLKIGKYTLVTLVVLIVSGA